MQSPYTYLSQISYRGFKGCKNEVYEMKVGTKID